MFTPSLIAPIHRSGGVHLPPIVFWDDFMGSEAWGLEGAGASSKWDVTGNADAVAEINDAPGGIFRLDLGFQAGASTATMRQFREPFQVKKGRRFTVFARYRFDAVDNGGGSQPVDPDNGIPFQTHFGLGSLTTDPFDTQGVGAVGFYTLTNDTKYLAEIQTIVDNAATGSGARRSSGQSVEGGKLYEYAIEYDGNNTVSFYLDGKMIRRSQEASAIPFGVDMALHLSIAGPNTTHKHRLDVDYVGAVFERLPEDQE